MLILLLAPNLILAPATRENLESSVEQSVDVEFAKKFLPNSFIEEILKESEGEGIHCFGLTRNSKLIFDKLNMGDEVLLSETGTGLFTHFAVVTGKINNKSFGDALWPVSGSNSCENIYFLKNITKRIIDKEALLNKLGYADGFNLPDPIAVKRDAFWKIGSIRDIPDDRVTKTDKNILIEKPEIRKTVYKKNEIDIALRGKIIHIVFVADGGPSMYMSNITGADKLSYNAAANHTNTVNVKNETGTLYLLGYAVTLVPLSVFGNRDDLGNRNMMRTHIKDVFKANEEYIKLSEIFFCFEPRPDFDYQLAVDTINEEGARPYQYVQKISIL